MRCLPFLPKEVEDGDKVQMNAEEWSASLMEGYEDMIDSATAREERKR
jgi:hypothetical protein